MAWKQRIYGARDKRIAAFGTQLVVVTGFIQPHPFT
jgi:hypothetical protein